jgi:hypothetical protein
MFNVYANKKLLRYKIDFSKNKPIVKPNVQSWSLKLCSPPSLLCTCYNKLHNILSFCSFSAIKTVRLNFRTILENQNAKNQKKLQNFSDLFCLSEFKQSEFRPPLILMICFDFLAFSDLNKENLILMRRILSIKCSVQIIK